MADKLIRYGLVGWEQVGDHPEAEFDDQALVPLEGGAFVTYTDHAAAVARLESRLSLAEKVVEAARLRPWITRHSGDTEDSADVLRCEVCGFDWPDPEQITNADEYPEKHADSCETVAINEALSAYRSAK